MKAECLVVVGTSARVSCRPAALASWSPCASTVFRTGADPVVCISWNRKSGAKSITYEDLDKVPYAAAVIYEGMRMWPPVTPAVGLVSTKASRFTVVQVGHDTSLHPAKFCLVTRAWVIASPPSCQRW